MKKWVIYKIVSPSGRIYIGKTSNYEKRISYYKNGCCKKQPRLHASLKKYGVSQHEISIIEEIEHGEDYAGGKECFWIRSYMTNICKWPEGNGLNLTDGGEGTFGYKASDETKKKLRESHLGKPSGRKGQKPTDEQIKKSRETFFRNHPQKPKKPKPTKEETSLKMSLAKKGKPPHNKGKPMPPHQIELLRLINKGRPSHMKGKTFDHLSLEERKERFGKHNIGNSYNKGRKHRSEVVEAMAARKRGVPNTALYKPVIQCSLNGEFIAEYESIKSAAKSTGLSSWSIGNIAKGYRKEPDSYIFKYKQV